MKSAKAEELDRMFDEGEDMSEYMDVSAAVRLNRPKVEVKRVNVDFPNWMLDELDEAASRLAINRQAIIKTWLADRLRQEKIA